MSITSTSRPVIIFTRAVPGEVSIPNADVRLGTPKALDRAALLNAVKGAAIICSMFHDRIDAELLDAAGPNLRGVCNFAVGVDNIDLAACKARNIIVTNTPDVVTEGTANLAWGLILALSRKIVPADAFCRSGAFEHQGNGFPGGWMGLHLTGQNLLIVGAGRIGKAVALRGQAFGMSTLYAARSRHIDFEQAPLAARKVELEEGLKVADIVSIHTPLTLETRHLINAQRLALLKPTAILINTSRGPTVDESALAEALTRKALWGAGLDVFEHEPKIHPALAKLDNVVMTPHIGSAEGYWREQMTRMVCENVRAILAGTKAVSQV